MAISGGQLTLAQYEHLITFLICSSSNSSDSSSSSSSGSDSDSSDEEGSPKEAPSVLFPQMERSPMSLPGAGPRQDDAKWDLSTYFDEPTTSKSVETKPTVPSLAAARETAARPSSANSALPSKNNDPPGGPVSFPYLFSVGYVS